MGCQGGFQCRQGFFVKTEQQFFRRRGAEDFVEEDFQICIRHLIQAQRRLAHFADPLAQGGGVFSAVMGVETETHFQFVNRLGGEARGENLMQALEGVMIALEPVDTFLDGQAGLHRLVQRAKSGERRQAAVRLGGVHIEFKCAAIHSTAQNRGRQDYFGNQSGVEKGFVLLVGIFPLDFS